MECYINKNTPELRKILAKMGLICNNGKWMGKYLAVFQLDTDDWATWRYCGSPEYDLKNMPGYSNAVDCGNNEDLFLEITSMMDPEDIGWYWCDLFGSKVLLKCVGHGSTLNMMRGGTYRLEVNMNDKHYHIEKFRDEIEPASIKDVVEYFNKK